MTSGDRSPRILIFGAGAVGGYIGAHLAREDHDVVLCDPYAAHVTKMQQDGITLSGATEEECFTVPVSCVHPGELQHMASHPSFDIVFISVKSYDISWASMLVKSVLSARGFVVIMMNSTNEPEAAEILGWPRIVGGIANKIVVELTGPGHVRRSIEKGGGGFEVFRVGEPSGRITPRLQEVAALLSSIDSCKIITTLWNERWSKLVQNTMSNAIATISGLPTRTYIENAVTRRLSICTAGESTEIGMNLGYDLEPINNEDPQLWVDAAGEAQGRGAVEGAYAKAEAVVLAIAAKMQYTARPSMAQDVAKGRRSEILHINGLVVREAEAAGLAAPINKALVKAVQAVERGEAKPGLDLAASILP